jgi:prepilin-type N-terminal cleavage/methylation domain-containing protein
MLEKHSIWSVFCSKTTALYSKLGDRMKKRSLAFTLTEMLLALVVVAILAVLILPVVTTRAQNKSFALAYESQVKQLLNSLTGLHVMENVTDIKDTMMYVDAPVNDYTNSSGAYIKKYMKVSKYCGNSPGDCFAQKYFQYRDKDREEFTVADEGGTDKPFAQATKGACALLKNGVSICLKPKVKNAEGGTRAISGW